MSIKTDTIKPSSMKVEARGMPALVVMGTVAFAIIGVTHTVSGVIKYFRR